MDFAIKQGDLLPAFAATLVDTDANPIDLTGVTAAVLRYRLYDRLTPLIERTIAIVTPVTAGKVQYQWVAGDTDDSGLYCAEVELTFPTNKPMTFPTKHYFEIRIFGELG